MSGAGSLNQQLQHRTNPGRAAGVTASPNELLDLVTANVARRILDRRDEKREETTMTTDTNTSFKAMLRNKQFIAAFLIAASAAATGSAFASSGYGPAPHYDPIAGAPASQRGPNSLTIVIADAGYDTQAFGGMSDTTSQSGTRLAAHDSSFSTYSHH